ncbi:MAG: glycoside hydrolase family 2 protein, partial [Mycobacteriales bacterium]
MEDLRFAMPGRGAEARHLADFATGWRFGGRYPPGSERTSYDDSAFATVSLPHCVVDLGWLDWDPASWAGKWIYRRTVSIPAEWAGERIYLGFEGVLTGCTVWVNGVELPEHLGGYLPFGYEVTGHVRCGAENVIAVVVDGDWHDVPPDGAPAGPSAVDYCQPTGIYRTAHLRAVPPTHISDVFAKPVREERSAWRLDVEVTVDAVAGSAVPLRASLRDGGRDVGSAVTPTSGAAGRSVVSMRLDGLGEVESWDVDAPKLYDVVVDAGGHEYAVRVGFRDSRWEPDGFWLNGRRLQIFGINRHQLFPYVGMAMPPRVQRRDAEIIRRELRCNMVRCAHYPPAQEFLDACDELGLMVWDEPPGWQYLSEDAAYQRLIERDVAEMVRRDRNHPSIVTWGVRINESRNDPALYRRTKAMAYELDGTRQTTGSMVTRETEGWAQELFGFDDYTGDGTNAGLKEPIDDLPYLISEAVGAISAQPLYRRIDNHPVLAVQATAHAQVHEIAHANHSFAGLLGWVCFDYASQNGRTWRNLKTPGIVDGFRIPKYAAATYATYPPPGDKPALLPLFDWVRLCASSAADRSALVVATNCDRIVCTAGGSEVVTAAPDRTAYPALPHPPLTID